MVFLTYLLLCVILFSVPCFLFRSFLYSYLMGLCDYIFFHTIFIPMMKKKKNFWRGWGDVEILKKIKSLEFEKEAPTIEHSFIGEQIACVDKRTKYEYFRQEFRFESPLFDLLRDGEGIAEYSLMTTKKEMSKKCLVVILPAGGQQGYGWRNKNIAIPLMRSSNGKIDCLIPIVPCYHTRKSKHQDEGGISYQTLLDVPVTAIAFYEECRRIISHYSEHYENIIFTGVSMAGTFCEIVCCLHVSEKKIKLGSVSALGALYMDFDGYLFGKTVNYEALRKEKCPFIKNPESYALKNLMMKISSETTMDYVEKINGGKRTNHLMSTFLVARYDKLITEKMNKELEVETRRSLENSNFSEEEVSFKRVFLRGGHFSTFVDKGSIKRINKEILETFSKMEKI